MSFIKRAVLAWIEFTQETVAAIRKAKADRFKWITGSQWLMMIGIGWTEKLIRHQNLSIKSGGEKSPPIHLTK
jgi:hypothetical protein